VSDISFCTPDADAPVPVIDISAFRDGTDQRAVANAVGEACTYVGFLVISGHGIAEPVIATALEEARRFFHLPIDEKLRCRPAEPWFFRGYEPLGGSALARSLDQVSPPDLCELFRISRFDDPAVAARAGNRPGLEYFFGPNLWPEGRPELRAALERYYAALEALAATMMSIFAVALGLDPEHFAPFVDQHITNLCINYYPPQPEPPAEGQLRRGAHSDYGSMTILYQDDAPGGLQVRRKDGSWADVPHRPGTFVVNLGDLMARWTNDRWVSTVHRVVNPDRTAEQSASERLSMPFFHQPNFDAVIECLPGCRADGEPARHRPVTSGDWVLGKTRKQVGAS